MEIIRMQCTRAVTLPKREQFLGERHDELQPLVQASSCDDKPGVVRGIVAVNAQLPGMGSEK